ncbi:MAG: hypothetical protein AB8G05_04470 [Oligoflexales bacterium]
MQERQTPTTFQIWTKALELLSGQIKPIGKVGLLCFFLPYLVSMLFFAYQSSYTVGQIIETRHLDYTSILGPTYAFLIFTIGISLALLALGIAGFTAIVHISSAVIKEEEFSPESAIKLGLKSTFPHGLVIVIFASLMSLEHAFLGPFRIFTLFSLMAIVIMVNDRKGCFGALKHAMLFRYSSPIHGGGFSAAFVIIGLGALVFACEYSLGLLYELLLHADEYFNLPRLPWSLAIPSMPFSPMYFLANISYALGITMILSLVACYLVSLYYSVRSRINHMV